MDYLIGYQGDGRIQGFFVIDYPGATVPPGDFVAVSKQEYDRVFDDACTHYIDGKFVRIESQITTEQQAEHARKHRNFLLNQTDWTQMPDVAADTKQKYAEYRQLLRDISQQPAFPEDIVWPTAPSQN